MQYDFVRACVRGVKGVVSPCLFCASGAACTVWRNGATVQSGGGAAYLLHHPSLAGVLVTCDILPTDTVTYHQGQAV